MSDETMTILAICALMIVVVVGNLFLFVFDVVP